MYIYIMRSTSFHKESSEIVIITHFFVYRMLNIESSTAEISINNTAVNIFEIYRPIPEPSKVLRQQALINAHNYPINAGWQL